MSTAELYRVSDDLPWLSGRVPNGYWDIRENRLRYLDWLGRQLGLHTREDWYGVSAADFIENHGGTLFWRVYDSSVYSAMRDYRPDVQWLAWRFSKVPKGFWREVENRRRYMDWLATFLVIESDDDWYRLAKEHFIEHGGAGLLANHYGGSVLWALREYRSDYDWKPWLFSKVPHGFWRDPENRRQYLEWLEGVLEIRGEEDWYRVTKESFVANGGGGLLGTRYAGSILSLLREYRPEVDWKPWLFPKVPHGYWEARGNRRRYFAWLARRLRLRSGGDWRRLAPADLAANGGAGLFGGFYGRSMKRLREDIAAMDLGADFLDIPGAGSRNKSTGRAGR